MAKTKDAAELGIDEESLAVLEDQVKKGKTRKFILIYKGADIKKLIVFKKGPFGVKIQKAKKEGFRGEAVCGVVSGSGVSLNFQLAGNKDVADAMSVDSTCEKEPTKVTKLKEFLADNNLKKKPSYEIVTDPTVVQNPELDGDESAQNGEGSAALAEPDQASGVATLEEPDIHGGVASELEEPDIHGDTETTEAPPSEDEAKCKKLQAALTPKIKEAVAAAPEKKKEIATLLQTAVEQQKNGSWGEALDTLKLLGGVVTGVLSAKGTGPVDAPDGEDGPLTEEPQKADPNKGKIEAYEKELKAVKKLVAELKKHPHKAHITTELSEVSTELGKADTAFKAKNFDDAMKALKKAKETAEKAKGFADKFEAYSKKRAKAQYMASSFKSLIGNTEYNTQKANITAADNLAKAPTRNYAGATTKVEAVVTAIDGKLKTLITDTFITPNTPKISALKTGAQKTFLAKPIKECEAQMKTLQANVKAMEYNKSVPAGWKLNGLVRAAEAAATRRTEFDTQRGKTVTAVDGLKSFKSLATQKEGLDKRVKKADDLASLKNRQFENGAEELAKVETEAKELAKHGPAADEYAKDRPEADKAYSVLEKHKQAATQKSLIEGVKTKLDKAAEHAQDPAQMTQANEELQRAKRDIDSATEAMEEASALGVVAESATDSGTGKKALEALKVSFKNAKKHKHSKDFSKELKKIETDIGKTEKDLKDPKKVKGAVDNIKKIGEQLAEVTVHLTQQEGYVADRDALEKRLKSVQKLPEAKEIKKHIEPLEKVLKIADDSHKAHNFEKRAKAMDKGREAAALAEKTAKQCKEYNTRQQKLDTTYKGSALSASDKTKVENAIKSADAKAKDLKYDDANKLLKKAESTYETLLINDLAAQTPPDLAKITAAAKRMMKSGSAKEIDKLIQRLPNTTSHDVLKRLTKERYGIELKTDAGDETKSAKAMLAMLSKVPDDVVGNPSLKTVERRDPGDDGGFYRSSDQLVVMNGRPGQATQGFGATIASELPTNVDNDCKPKDASTVDYFDFATLHEVGHSVDDNLQFMESREGQADFGGWTSYGGEIGPVVKAVADWTGYNSTKEQKQAISDLILGNKVTWPTPPKGKEAEWNTAKTKVTDWHALATWDQIWWKQNQTDKITINGKVYHQAYSRQWVSYDAAARRKGITGYQFRAPGEWFAELYAAYRMDKLKASHPAVKWLSKIKV